MVDAFPVFPDQPLGAALRGLEQDDFFAQEASEEKDTTPGLTAF